MKRISAALQLIAAAVVLRRFAEGRGRAAALTAGSSTVSTVSVVVPARNEAHRLTTCLAAVKDAHEVIVVDDESTDETAVVAERLGAHVVHGAPLPNGWVGKPWAMQQGLLRASGDIVLFLDADTIPQNGLIGAIETALDGTDAVTLAPRFVTSSMTEQALHASMLAGLVFRHGAVGTEKTSPEQVTGNGQCLAARRQWLLDQGGAALSATHMTDDIALVRALAARGARVRFLDGREIIQVRMHRSIGEVWREWGRSLPMTDVTPPLKQVLGVSTLWLTMTVPMVRALSGRSTPLDKLLLGVRALVSFALAPSYVPPRRGVYLSPLFDIAAVARITQATLLPVRTWKGRKYGQPGTGGR